MMAAMAGGLGHFIRRRIAIKLTLTLVGFVAIAMLAAGVYLSRALERFAEDSLAARLATAGRGADTARRFLEVAFRHTERLGRLLNDLTDLSNIELGKVSLRLAPTQVQEVIDSTLAIIQARADAGRVTMTSEVEPKSLTVYADHTGSRRSSSTWSTTR